MGVSAGPDCVENGLVLSLDPATSNTYFKNVHPKPNDIFGWYFDNGGGTTGNNCIVSRDTTIVSPVGGNPLRMFITGNDPYLFCYNSSTWNLFPASIGETWTISVYVKASGPTVNAGTLFLFGAPASGNVFDATFGEITGGNITFTQDWSRVSYTYTFTKPVSFIQLRLDGPDSGATGQTIWWDGLQVENQSSPTTFDGTRTTTAAIVDKFGNTIRPISAPTITNDTISFDGVNDYLQLANTLNVDTSQGFAIAMWIRQGATQTSNFWNYFLYHNYGTNVMEFGAYGTNATTFGFKDNGLNLAVTSSNLTTGYNYLVFGTDNNRLPYMYTVNASGTTVSTQSVPFANTTIQLRNLFASPTSYYKCDIKLLQVYNRALTATEVAQNFAALRSRFGI